jgi:hypothetical protein
MKSAASFMAIGMEHRAKGSICAREVAQMRITVHLGGSASRACERLGNTQCTRTARTGCPSAPIYEYPWVSMASRGLMLEAIVGRASEAFWGSPSKTEMNQSHRSASSSRRDLSPLCAAKPDACTETREACSITASTQPSNGRAGFSLPSVYLSYIVQCIATTHCSRAQHLFADKSGRDILLGVKFRTC